MYGWLSLPLKKPTSGGVEAEGAARKSFIIVGVFIRLAGWMREGGCFFAVWEVGFLDQTVLWFRAKGKRGFRQVLYGSPLIDGKDRTGGGTESYAVRSCSWVV